jgi:hypothetical protein
MGKGGWEYRRLIAACKRIFGATAQAPICCHILSHGQVFAIRIRNKSAILKTTGDAFVTTHPKAAFKSLCGPEKFSSEYAARPVLGRLPGHISATRAEKNRLRFS